jgi:hypothetical protein
VAKLPEFVEGKHPRGSDEHQKLDRMEIAAVKESLKHLRQRLADAEQ